MATNKIKFDTTELLAKILERYNTIDHFATEVRIKPTTLKSRLASKTEFHFDEIRRICTALGVCSSGEVTRLFFTKAMTGNV